MKKIISIIRKLFGNSNPDTTHSPLSRYVRILLPIIFLCGCYTQRKAEEQAHRGLDKFPIEVGKIFRDKFPCIDGQVITGDSSAIKEWMAATEETARFYEELLRIQKATDTIIQWNNDEACEENYNTCVGKYKDLYETHKILKEQFEKILNRKPAVRVDTVKVKDSYDLDAAVSAKEKCENSFREVVAEKTKLDKKHKASVWENWIWRIVAGCLFLLFLFGRIKNWSPIKS